MQVHVVQDCNNGKPSPKTFGVVVLLKVAYADGFRLVATCSLCPEAPTLRSYLNADYTSTNCPPFDHSKFMDCEHAHHVIGSLFSQIVKHDDTSPEAIENEILSAMTDAITIPNGWLEIPDELPMLGTFAVHISEYWDIQVLKVYCQLNTRYIVIVSKKFVISV